MNTHHYFLIAGEIVFHNDGGINSVRLNAVATSNQSKIPARGVAVAQQACQHAFTQRMDGLENINILDVVIMSIVYLGEFTQEEFQAPPEGMEMQPVAQDVVQDIDTVVDILGGDFHLKNTVN